jgi:hypothetical protein
VPIAKQIRTGLIALAFMVCAAESDANAQAANPRIITNAEGVQVPSEAFENELSCIYEAAGWDAMMNFAEAASLRADNETLRERIAVEIADCAAQHKWDAETQTLAFDAFFYSALLEYNIEQTGSAQFDGAVISEIWGGLSDEDKVGLAADDADKNAALLPRVAAVIRTKVPNASDKSITYALNALAAVTLYASIRDQWSQKPVVN